MSRGREAVRAAVKGADRAFRVVDGGKGTRPPAPTTTAAAGVGTVDHLGIDAGLDGGVDVATGQVDPNLMVLSIGAVTLMFILIRRGAAAEVASLFFLVPPTTAVLGWLAFGERVDLFSLIGMVMVVAAVALVTWRRR